MTDCSACDAGRTPTMRTLVPVFEGQGAQSGGRIATLVISAQAYARIQEAAVRKPSLLRRITRSIRNFLRTLLPNF